MLFLLSLLAFAAAESCQNDGQKFLSCANTVQQCLQTGAGSPQKSCGCIVDYDKCVEAIDCEGPLKGQVLQGAEQACHALKQFDQGCACKDTSDLIDLTAVVSSLEDIPAPMVQVSLALVESFVPTFAADDACGKNPADIAQLRSCAETFQTCAQKSMSDLGGLCTCVSDLQMCVQKIDCTGQIKSQIFASTDQACEAIQSVTSCSCKTDL